MNSNLESRMTITYEADIYEYMKTTIDLKDDLVREAMEATGIREKTTLVHLGLRELIHKAARERLIKIGGSDPAAKPPVRRKMPRR